MAITREHVLQALSTVPVDAGGTNLVASGRLSEVVVDDARPGHVLDPHRPDRGRAPWSRSARPPRRRCGRCRA